MSKIQSSRAEDVLFNVLAMERFSEDCQYLVALSPWQISLILSAIRYANWPSRWVNVNDFAEIREKMYLLEHCLMSGCSVSDLIITNRLLIGAITGQVVDLDVDLPMEGQVDFSAVGLSPKFEGANGNITIAVEAIQTALEAIQAATEDSELEDDLANVWFVLKAAAIVLGATVGEPPEPL